MVYFWELYVQRIFVYLKYLNMKTVITICKKCQNLSKLITNYKLAFPLVNSPFLSMQPQIFMLNSAPILQH